MRRWLLMALPILWWLFSAGSLYAHETRPAFLGITEIAPDTFELMLKVPAKGPQNRLPLQVEIPRECQSLRPLTSHYLRGAFFDRTTFAHPNRLANASFLVTGLSETVIDVLVQIRFLDGTSQTARLTPDQPELIINPVPDRFSVARTYTWLGVEHIWLGIDHLLFVLCLLLVTRTRKKLLITITGFTLAHSVTLALSALEVVQLPIPPVEAVIALSIVFLAFEILRNDETSLTFRYPVVVSTSFGLLHGFGFAAVLAEIGLPPTQLPTALLFFNVGVEVGQLLFVGVLMGMFMLIRSLWKRFQDPEPGTGSTVLVPRLRLVLIYLIGTVASYWMIERIVGFWG